MRPRNLAALLALCLGGAACADIEDGRFTLLLTPPHLGRNQNEDPFALVARLSVGLLDRWGNYTALGEGAPGARLDLGLVAAGKEGYWAVIGKNDRGRPVSAGMGALSRIDAGARHILALPFLPAALAPVSRLLPGEEEQLNPFQGRRPSLRLTEVNLESGNLKDAGDLQCLVTALWSETDLWFEITVADDQVTSAGAGLPLTQGDAVRLYLDGKKDGPGGADDMILTVSADGRMDPEGLSSHVSAETLDGGYRLRLRLPFAAVAKNVPVGFDLRVIDFDGVDAPARLTWAFDPRQPEDDPQPSEYGSLLPEVPLLPALAEPQDEASFDGPDGPVAVSVSYLPDRLSFSIEVPDGEVLTVPKDADLAGSDRAEILIDLANGRPPIPESTRFFSLAIGAGGSTRARAGSDPARLSPDGVRYTGQASGTVVSGGYRIQAEIPFEDLGAEPQPGWFLGLDVRIVDEDAGSSVERRWSQSPDPGRWPELRLWHRE